MSPENAYPEKPELQYRRTKVDMPDVVIALKAMDVPAVVKRAVYTIFRFESNNGKSGVNNNYSGMQADGGRWQAKYDHLIEGTCVQRENAQPGHVPQLRRFLCFRSFSDFLIMYVDKIWQRGIYVGGTTHLKVKMPVKNATDLVRAYEKDWVKGRATAEPSAEKIKNFLSVYKQAETIFL